MIMAVKLECRGKVGGTQECAACGKKIHDRYLLKVSFDPDIYLLKVSFGPNRYLLKVSFNPDRYLLKCFDSDIYLLKVSFDPNGRPFGQAQT
jgi:hypothetical protein